MVGCAVGYCGQDPSFGEGESVAGSVERPARSRRESLERVKTSKDKLAEGIVSADEGAFALARTDNFPAVADSICAGGTSVGDDIDRADQIVGAAKSHGLALREIMGDAGGLMSISTWIFNCGSIEILAHAHAAAGGAEDDGGFLGGIPMGLSQRLISGAK